MHAGSAPCQGRLLQGHKIAEVLLRLGYPPTIETKVLWVLGDLFDLIKLSLTCKNTEMTRMLPFTCLLSHFSLPTLAVLQNLQSSL